MLGAIHVERVLTDPHLDDRVSNVQAGIIAPLEGDGVDTLSLLQRLTMDPALSGSSISNDDSNSDLVEDIEDDFEMSSPTATPVTVYPYALQQFPVTEYNKLCEGLYRLPSWVVYPSDLGSCLQAAATIVREAQRQGHHAWHK